MPFAYLLWFDFFLIRFIYSISCSHICINHNFFFRCCCSSVFSSCFIIRMTTAKEAKLITLCRPNSFASNLLQWPRFVGIPFLVILIIAMSFCPPYFHLIFCLLHSASFLLLLATWIQRASNNPFQHQRHFAQVLQQICSLLLRNEARFNGFCWNTTYTYRVFAKCHRS